MPNALDPDLCRTSRKQTVLRVNFQLARYGQGFELFLSNLIHNAGEIVKSLAGVIPTTGAIARKRRIVSGFEAIAILASIDEREIERLSNLLAAQTQGVSRLYGSIRRTVHWLRTFDRKFAIASVVGACIHLLGSTALFWVQRRSFRSNSSASKSKNSCSAVQFSIFFREI